MFRLILWLDAGIGVTYCLRKGLPPYFKELQVTVIAFDRKDPEIDLESIPAIPTSNVVYELPKLRKLAFNAFEARLEAAIANKELSGLPLQDAVPIPETVAAAITAGEPADVRKYLYSMHKALLTLFEDNIQQYLKAMPEIIGANRDPVQVVISPAKKPDYIWYVNVAWRPVSANAMNSGMDSPDFDGIIVRQLSGSDLWAKYGLGADAQSVRKEMPSHPLVRDFRMFAPEFMHPDRNDVFFVAEIDGKVVGLSQVTMEASDRRAASLCFVEVSPEHRKQGIAKKMVHELSSWAKRERVAVINSSSYTSIGEVALKKILRSACEESGVRINDGELQVRPLRLGA